MQLLDFPLESIEENLPAVQLDDGTWLFSAQETCVFGEIASRVNAAKWVRTNIPAKWIVELKTKEGNGRPGLYLTKPGFYYAVCQGKSEKALKFRDEVFEVILPKIDASGVAMTPNVTSEAIAKEWGLQGKSAEQLLFELNTLLSKQDALKFGAAYHGKLIKIREYAQRKILCEDTKNDKLWSAIGKLEEQLVEEYKNSNEFPQEFWEQFYDSKTRQYWISQWRDGKHYKTHLNETLGN